MWNKVLSDFWCNVKFSLSFTTEYKEIWKENLVIYQTSLKGFLQAPLQLQVLLTLDSHLKTAQSENVSDWNNKSQITVCPLLDDKLCHNLVNVLPLSLKPEFPRYLLSTAAAPSDQSTTQSLPFTSRSLGFELSNETTKTQRQPFSYGLWSP